MRVGPGQTGRLYRRVAGLGRAVAFASGLADPRPGLPWAAIGAGLVIVGWRPFLDPLPLHQAWWALLVPLSFLVAMVYKAVRLPTLEGYWRAVGVMTAQIVLLMAVLWVAVFVAVRWLIPLLAP